MRAHDHVFIGIHIAGFGAAVAFGILSVFQQLLVRDLEVATEVVEFLLAVPRHGRVEHPALDGRPIVLDAMLQLHQTVKHGFRTRGAAGDVHIDRNQAINALKHRVVLVKTPG